MQHLFRFAALAVVMSCVLCSAKAEAQLGRGNWRISLDTDMLAVANVDVDPERGTDYDVTVISVGPNQLGGSRVVQPATPLGFGVGYTMSPKLVLGVRTGLGVDIRDGGDDKIRNLDVSLMPGLTFVPIGHKAKLFLSLAGIFQVNREKQDERRDRVMYGGFSTGIGTLIFPSSRFSADLGFFFEGRFGGRKFDNPDGPDDDLRDMRGVVRLGFSLWT
jgi:hypothetical protein